MNLFKGSICGVLGTANAFAKCRDTEYPASVGDGLPVELICTGVKDLYVVRFGFGQSGDDISLG